MIEPGSMGDWLQASLMAGVLGGLAAAGHRALRMEEAERATPRAVPRREPTAPRTPAPAEPTPGGSGP